MCQWLCADLRQLPWPIQSREVVLVLALQYCLLEGGRLGRLVDIIRTTNVLDSVAVTSIAPGRRQYVGSERSGIYGILVVSKTNQ
jgi:hypothetical protein